MLEALETVERLSEQAVQGVAYLSVVPKFDNDWRMFVKGRNLPFHQISYKDFSLADLGLSLDYPKPETIGADRLADAVAAVDRYGAPVLVCDFGTAFTGAAAFEENVFDFTVNGDGSVSGVIDMGAAAISFPTECTANVSFADGMKTGTYTLVQGDSIASGTSWTLNIRNGGSRIATIVQNDGTVVLEVRGLGTVVTVR
jgi:hypothetical protein